MSLHKYHHRSLLHSSSSSSLLLMNKTRCEIALDLSLRAVQHDLDGDSAFARKLYEDAARALEDAIAHAKKEKSMAVKKSHTICRLEMSKTPSPSESK